MNIYEKLQSIRCDLQSMNIKKSGRNTYSNYDYYELRDFLPTINDLLLKYKATSVITFSKEIATLTLIDIEKVADQIVFSSPMVEASVKGAQAIQNLGAVETYQRRYLYMTAFEITETDQIDQGSNKQKQHKQQDHGQSKKQKQQSSDQPLISEATAAALNKSIKNYHYLTNISITTIKKTLETNIHKSIDQVNEDDARKINNMFKKWTSEHYQKQNQIS